MAGLINFGITDPSLVQNSTIGAGMREAEDDRNKRALNAQTLQMNDLKISDQKLDLEKLKREREMMIQFQDRLKSMGKDPNLENYFDTMVGSGIPDYVQKGMEGKQKLREQRQYAQIMGFNDSTQAASSTPSLNRLPGSSSQMINDDSQVQASRIPAVNVNALTSKQQVPSINALNGTSSTGNAVTNQFGDSEIAKISDRITRLTALGTPQALNTAKVLQDQLEMIARQKGSIPKQKDNFIPVGDRLFDITNNKFVDEGQASNLKPKDRYMTVGKNVFDAQNGNFIEGVNPSGVPEGIKLKPGERYNKENDRVDAIKGSDLYIKQSKDHAGDQKLLQTVDLKTDAGISKIDQLLNPVNKEEFNNLFGGYTAYGTQYLSKNLRTKLDSLKSDMKAMGLDVVRTGGRGIGSITQREWPILEKMIDSISPEIGEQEARNRLSEIKNRMESMRDMVREGYGSQWGNTQYYKPSKSENKTAESSDQDHTGALKFIRDNPNDPRAKRVIEAMKKAGIEVPSTSNRSTVVPPIAPPMVRK